MPVQVGRPASAASRAPSPDAYPGVTAAFRAGIVVLSLAIAVFHANVTQSAPWLVALVVPEAVIRGRALDRGRLALLAAWWVIVTTVGVCFTGGGASPLLPLLVVASLLASLSAGAYGTTVAGGCSSLILLIGWVFRSTHDVGTARAYFGAVSEWVILALAVGLVVHWFAIGEPRPADDRDVRYGEARALLRQLNEVTAGLPGSLDAVTTCEVLLDTCLRLCDATQGAVLTDVGEGYLVPMALHATRRVPWRSPLSGPGPLQQAWATGETVLDARLPDVGGRRAGSALLVVPIVAPEGVLGLVALQASHVSAFPDSGVADIEAAVRRTVLQLETARLFDVVRSRVTMEERARLAREMHDGVAQDLAYLGFELDSLRMRATKLDGGFAREIAGMRAAVTRTIGDIRASISDLRSTGSFDRGLGAALASFVRNLGLTKNLTVHLSLSESTFRLQSEVEVLLFRLAQGLTTSVRDHSGAEHLWVELVVDPPTAELRIAHDGPAGFRTEDLEQATAKVAGSGIALTVSQLQPVGAEARAVYGGTDGDDATASG